MLKLRKVFLTILLSSAFVVLYCTDVFAVDFMNETAKKTLQMFKHVKGIIYVLGAFGLVGIAFSAIFGKLKWNWMSGLAVGLVVLAAAGGVVDYMTNIRGASVVTAPSGRASDIFQFFSVRTQAFAIGLRNVAFCLSGFGIIMFTFAAIWGKINFKHLGYIVICLFMLSGTGLLISYISGGGERGSLGKLNNYAKPGVFTPAKAGDTLNRSVSM